MEDILSISNTTQTTAKFLSEGIVQTINTAFSKGV